MTAGASAAQFAEYQTGLADELERQAVTAREVAQNFTAAHHSERKLARALAPLRAEGYFVLEDRRWPKSRGAQVDFVLVGPGGVFIVDAKTWRDVHLATSGRETRIFRDQADVTDEIANLADLADKTEAALAEIGLPPSEVRAIAAFTSRSAVRGRVLTVEIMSDVDVVTAITSRRRQLTSGQVETVLRFLLDHFPAIGEVDAPAVLVKAPALSLVPPLDEQPELITVDEVQAALLEGIEKQPIEEWMAFLHPDQAKLVRRSYSGPCRIRGAAGTGKTVVGLHRAAYLAKTKPGRVLVTTYVKTLPAVLGSMLARIQPEVVDRVDFAGVYEFAGRVLKLRGIQNRINPKAADAAFDLTWARLGARGKLADIDPEKSYWKDEIAWVIKGRGLASLGQYLECARPGRRRRLTADQRTEVWALFAEYEKELRSRNVWDFADIILQAEAALRIQPLDGYSAVVIDEAQDLTCAMVRMLHSLVGDSPDGLNLIGDGQQTIYPGGYTLSEIGISLQGRGAVMTRNYRNTVEIAEFAASLVAGDEFVDIEGMLSSPDAAEITRRGPRPRITRFPSLTAHNQRFVDHVQSLIASGVAAGDIGVLAQTNRQAEDAMSHLRRVGVAVVALTDYDGSVSDAVKVGTIKRAKGLEFKQVVVVRAPAALGSGSVPESERARLEARELYVAMTRARDGLWVGVV